MLLKAVLLDFGNVFVDESFFTPAAQMGVVRFVKQRAGLIEDEQTLYKKLRNTPQLPADHVYWKQPSTRDLLIRMHYFKDFASSCGLELDDKAIKEMMQAYDEAAAESGVIEGTEEAVKSLRKHFKLAIVSNGYAGFIHATLRKYNLRQYFDEVIVSQEVNFDKPSREIYQLTTGKLGVDFSDTIMVGDGFKGDIEGPKKMGMVTCWVNATGAENPNPAMCDFVVQRLIELPPFIL